MLAILSIQLSLLVVTEEIPKLLILPVSFLEYKCVSGSTTSSKTDPTLTLTISSVVMPE